MHRIPSFLLTLSLFLLLLGGAFLGFEQVVLDPAVYDRLQSDIGHYDYIGLTPDAQSRVNIVLADYLAGTRQDINIEESLLGTNQQVFNADEKAHMIDVYNLFVLERRVRSVSLSAGLLLLGAACLLSRKKLRQTALSAAKAFILSFAALAAALVLLCMTSGFDRLFILFHELLFTNELWLMDPRTDAMIRMFPSEFFLRIACESGVSALVYGLAFTAAAWLTALAAGSIINHPRRKQTP